MRGEGDHAQKFLDLALSVDSAWRPFYAPDVRLCAMTCNDGCPAAKRGTILLVCSASESGGAGTFHGMRLRGAKLAPVLCKPLQAVQ